MSQIGLVKSYEAAVLLPLCAHGAPLVRTSVVGTRCTIPKHWPLPSQHDYLFVVEVTRAVLLIISAALCGRGDLRRAAAACKTCGMVCAPLYASVLSACTGRAIVIRVACTHVSWLTPTLYT